MEVSFFHRKPSPIMMEAKTYQVVDEIVMGGDGLEIGIEPFFLVVRWQG
jgi:hypothetical protein